MRVVSRCKGDVLVSALCSIVAGLHNVFMNLNIQFCCGRLLCSVGADFIKVSLTILPKVLLLSLLKSSHRQV